MKNWWLIFAMSLFIVSCRNEEVLVDIETHVVTTPEYTEIDVIRE